MMTDDVRGTQEEAIGGGIGGRIQDAGASKEVNGINVVDIDR
jgi:hypothetical protein